MKFRLRAWLASLAFCYAPSFADAQQFLHQDSTAPVALEARLSLTEHGWDPAALVAALAPGGTQVAVAAPVPDPASPPERLAAEPREPAPESSLVGSDRVGDSACTVKRQQCLSASDVAGQPKQISPHDELIGVDYCIPEALRRRIAIAEKLAELAGEEPADAATNHAASAAPAGERPEPFTVMVPMFEIDGAVVSARDMPHGDSSDSPVIVTLTQQEEYLSYDLTAIDRLKMRLFPLGLAPYRDPVQIPMQPADGLESADSESGGETAAVASANGIPQHAIPIDCLLDEIVWDVSKKLQAESRLRRNLRPHRIGQNLARMMSSASERADQMLGAVAARMPSAPADPVLLNAPQPIQLAGQPGVCCPFNPETPVADLETPLVSGKRASVEIDCLAVEGALAVDDPATLGVLTSELASEEAASDVTVHQLSDMVDEIVAAYAGSLKSEVGLATTEPGLVKAATGVMVDGLSDVVDEVVAAYAGSLEREVGLATAEPASVKAATDATVDGLSDVVDEVVAAYAGSLEREVGLATAEPASEKAATDATVDGLSDVVDEVVAAYAGSLESEVDPVFERTLQEWQKMIEVVQSLSDQWSQRIANQPEANAVR